MSASDALPSGDSPSPNSVLTGTIAFLNGGGQLGTLLQGAIFGRSCRLRPAGSTSSRVASRWSLRRWMHSRTRSIRRSRR